VSTTPTPTDDGERPPLGSWRTTYVLVCALATLVMALLWWLTASFNLGAVR